MLLALLIGNILLVSIVAANPMYTRAMLQRTLSKRLETYLAESAAGAPRKYYRLTNNGKKHLKEKTDEWKEYSSAVSKVLEGGLACELF